MTSPDRNRWDFDPIVTGEQLDAVPCPGTFDALLAEFIAVRRDIDNEPLNPAHTAELEQAIGDALIDVPRIGGAE
jgi:hypothetical protein